MQNYEESPFSAKFSPVFLRIIFKVGKKRLFVNSPET